MNYKSLNNPTGPMDRKLISMPNEVAKKLEELSKHFGLSQSALVVSFIEEAHARLRDGGYK